MMNFKISIFLLCIVLGLSACSSKNRHASEAMLKYFNQNQPLPQNVGIVIGNGHDSSGGVIFKYSQPKVQSSIGDRHLLFTYANTTNFHAYLVPAGYFATQAIFHQYTFDRWGLNTHTKQPKYGGFHVRAGEIIYIGDLQVLEDTRGDGPLRINVIDNFALATQYFNKNYPNYRGRLQKRLLFSQR